MTNRGDRLNSRNVLNYLLIAVLIPALSFIYSFNALAEKTYTPETLPSQIRRAVTFSNYLTENHITNKLDGRATGYLTGELQLETAPTFNLYEEKLSITVGPEYNIEILQKPPVIRFYDPVSRSLKSGYRGQVVFKYKINLPSTGITTLPAKSRIPMIVGFQVCNKELCLLPANLELDVPLFKKTRMEPTSSPGTAWLNQATWLDRQSEFFKAALSTDGLGIKVLLLLMLAGLLTAFTPCVYPLYPITIGIFSKWSSDSSSRTLILSFIYCLGLTLSYAVIGLLTASSGLVFGSITQTPLFLIGVGTLIALSAIFFSGLLPFQAPQFLQKIFSGSGGMTEQPFSKRLMQALSMGAGLGIVAAPCVGPVIIALMAWLTGSLAQSSSAYIDGAIALSFFGFGMSLPFLVLANILVGLHKQPHLGRFTPWFKHIGTVLMLAGSLFFIVPGVQLLVKKPGNAHLPFSVWTLEEAPRDQWTVIDFRADWCAACQELESETFSSANIAAYFSEKSWAFVQHDLTLTNDANQAVIDKFGIIGLPTVLIRNPSGKVCRGLELFGFENAEKFEARLKRAVDACE